MHLVIYITLYEKNKFIIQHLNFIIDSKGLINILIKLS